MKTKSSTCISRPSAEPLIAPTEHQASQIRGRGNNCTGTYIVPMVARAIHITQTLQKEDAFLTLDDLLKVTGYSRTTVYRILRTLASFGYVQHQVRCGKPGWCASSERYDQRETKEPYSSW